MDQLQPNGNGGKDRGSCVGRRSVVGVDRPIEWLLQTTDDGRLLADCTHRVSCQKAVARWQSGGIPVGIIGEIHRIDPAAAETVAAVGHAVAEAVAAAGAGGRRSDDFVDREIGWRDAEDADRPGTVVVVVNLMRVMRVDLRGEGVFEDQVVGVAPDAEVILAGEHIVGNPDLRGAEIVFADGELAETRGQV